MNWELSDVQAGFRKARGTRDQIANISWIMEKAREFQKTSASLTMLKPVTPWITTNCGKFFKTGMPDHLTCLLRNLYAGQETIVKTDMKQQTGSKLGKEYIKTIYCHPVYLIYMQSTSCEMPGLNHSQAGIKITLEKEQQPQMCRWYNSKEPLEERKSRVKKQA